MTYKKGQELELTIEGLAYGGRGVARENNFVFFGLLFFSLCLFFL